MPKRFKEQLDVDSDRFLNHFDLNVANEKEQQNKVNKNKIL